MGRQVKQANFVAAAVLLLGSFCVSVQAQSQNHSRQQGPPPRGPAPVQSMRERWLSLPPAAQQNFRRNAERWMQMSPAERNLMRQRENLRREQIRRETDAALHDSGLRLDQERRALFESRYIQERRRMEQTLRQKIETERDQQLPALIQQLRKEFQLQQPSGNPTTKPGESPKSGK